MSQIKNNNNNVYQELSPKLKQTIKEIARQEGHREYNILCTSMSTHGGNFLSVLYEVDIEGKTPLGDKETNIFIKQTLDIDVSAITSIDKIFLNEAFFYKEIAKIYKDLQEEANIPTNERYRTIKSYGCDDTTILMDNLTRQGYKTLHKTTIGDWEYNKRCVNELAKFHALSFALEKKNSKYFDQKIRPMRLLYSFNEDWKKVIVNILKFSISFFNNDTKTKLESLVPELVDRMMNYFVNVTPESLKCLCHGDYRPNNLLMFKDKGKITSLIPIDYQMVYYGNPVMDLQYFIAFSTDRKFREVYLTNLKDTYFNTFTIFLKYFDIKVEDVFSRKEFEQYFQESQDYCLITSLIMLPFVYGSDDNTPDIEDYVNGTAEIDPIIGDRLRQLTDIINSCNL